MTEEQEEKKREAMYRDIGEFVFNFSNLEETIRLLLAECLELRFDLVYPVTVPYDFRMLCSVTSEVMRIINPDDGAGLHKRISKTFNRCLALNNKYRVPLAHGTWNTVGALHVGRQTFEPSVHFYEDGSIAAASAEAARLGKEIMSLPLPQRLRRKRNSRKVPMS